MKFEDYLSRSQFATLVGKSYSYIKKCIGQGKLIEQNKKLYVHNSTNKAFIAKYVVEDIQKVEEFQQEVLGSAVVEKPTRTKNGVVLKETDIDFKLKSEDLKLKRVRLKKEKLDLAKKEGKMIELLSGKEIMRRAVIVLSSKYRQQSKQYITSLAAKYDIPDTDLAGIQKQFDETINKAVLESKDLICAECLHMANELSGTLNVGESS